jgi:ectoine hydroxylase-related dioxygenase (phytanoyl-CoA dioxygenase family)
MLNVGIYLDELIMDNGPIWIAPGPDVDGIPLNLPEGSAVIFDCTLAHKGGGNRIGQSAQSNFPNLRILRDEAF